LGLEWLKVGVSLRAVYKFFLSQILGGRIQGGRRDRDFLAIGAFQRNGSGIHTMERSLKTMSVFAGPGGKNLRGKVLNYKYENYE
jgi:hypothetical protein